MLGAVDCVCVSPHVLLFSALDRRPFTVTCSTGCGPTTGQGRLLLCRLTLESCIHSCGASDPWNLGICCSFGPWCHGELRRHCSPPRAVDSGVKSALRMEFGPVLAAH